MRDDMATGTSPMKVALSGFLVDPTGFGEAARRYLHALDVAGAEVGLGHLLMDGGDQLDPKENWTWAGITKRRPMSNADVHFVLAQAAQIPMVRLKARKQIGFTSWETTKLPPSYLAGVSGLDALILPCAQNTTLYADAGYDRAHFVPIPVIGPYEWAEGWEGKLKRAGEGMAEYLKIGDETFVFYTVATWQPRKNPEGILISYLTAFSGYDDVLLVMKVSGGAAQLQMARNRYRDLLVDLNIPNPPKVQFIGGAAQFTEEGLWGVHARGDCYVSLSRGEACCIPLVDAYAIGTPVIAPRWGGHRDYMSVKDDCWRVVGGWTPVVQRYPFFDGSQRWFEPNLCEAQYGLQQIYKRGRSAKFRRDDTRLKTPAQVGAQLLEIFSHGD